MKSKARSFELQVKTSSKLEVLQFGNSHENGSVKAEEEIEIKTLTN